MLRCIPLEWGDQISDGPHLENVACGGQGQERRSDGPAVSDRIRVAASCFEWPRRALFGKKVLLCWRGADEELTALTWLGVEEDRRVHAGVAATDDHDLRTFAGQAEARDEDEQEKRWKIKRQNISQPKLASAGDPRSPTLRLRVTIVH